MGSSSAAVLVFSCLCRSFRNEHFHSSVLEVAFHDMEPIPGLLVGIVCLYCLAYTAVKHSTLSLGGELVETKERKKKLAQRASLRRVQ